MAVFDLGVVIERLNCDLGTGEMIKIVKYHPWKVVNYGRVLYGQPDINKVLYYCEQLSESRSDLFTLLISFIARQNLGHNQQALVAGIARSLKCKI